MNDEFNFILQDRIAKIQAINQEYDLLNNSYVAFSGGKDSTVLHYLLDIALPGNKIPRVYINTGIEYKFVREFVYELSKNDDRIIIVNSGINLKKLWTYIGYPFKSKEHSKKVDQYQRTKLITDYLDEYINGSNDSRFHCPDKLKYQFTNSCNLRISHLCCQYLKKQPMHNWAFVNNKSINLTGMRKEEGGTRANINCVLYRNNKLVSFHPLLVLNEDFINYFVQVYNIKLCKLYYPPFNFERTGCKGCPFALTLEEQLNKMAVLLPNEYKQCNIIWKPVYDEYKRLNYRLHKFSQLSLFD